MRCKPLLIGLAVALLVGLAHWFRTTRHDWEPITPPDPWYRAVSDEFHSDANTKEVPATEFGVVTANEGKALTRLEQAEWLEVSPREAEELVGQPLGGTGGRLVLLRGLSYDKSHGLFTVNWRPSGVRVNYGCLGNRPLPVVRRAIVARLPELPTAVYVDLDMAE